MTLHVKHIHETSLFLKPYIIKSSMKNLTNNLIEGLAIFTDFIYNN